MNLIPYVVEQSRLLQDRQGDTCSTIKNGLGGKCVENEEPEFTVEYQDSYGVLYFENVKAFNLSDAKMKIRQRLPDVSIRAVTVVVK